MTQPQPLRQALREHLTTHPNRWFTVDELMKELPTAYSRRETLTRALRRLVENGGIYVRRVVGTRREKQWSLDGRGAGSASATASPPLATATSTLVREFVQAGKTFSAYNVTTELRRRVNAGDVILDRHIDHAPVREVVHDLYDRGVLDSYVRVLHAGPNAQYWIYEPRANGGGNLPC